MRIGSMTVSVDGDTAPLEAKLATAKDKAKAGGQAISDALGEGLSGAQEQYQKIDSATLDWLERHKGLMATAAAVTAGVWALANPDEAKAYWDTTVQAAGNALESMKASISDYADKAKQSFQSVEDTVNTFGEAIGRGTLFKTFDTLGGLIEQRGKDIAKLVTEMQKLSEFKGISVQDLSGASQVGAFVNGTSYSEMTSLLGKIKEAQDGDTDSAKQMQQQYANLGVALKNNDGTYRDQLAVLAQVSLAETQWGDSSKVLAANRVLFGEALNANTNDLLKYPVTIQTVMQQAQQSGMVFSDAEVASLRKINDELQVQQAQEAVWAAKRQIIWADMGSAMRADSLDFLNNQQSVWDTLGKIWDDSENGLQRLAQNFLDSHQLMAKAIVFVMDHGGNDFANWLQNDLPEKIKAGWQYVVNGLGDMLVQTVQYVGNVLSGILEKITSMMESIPSVMRGKMGMPDDAQIADQKRAAQEIKDVFSSLSTDIQNYTQMTADAVTGNLVNKVGSALSALGQMAKSAYDPQAAAVAIEQAKRQDATLRSMAGSGGPSVVKTGSNSGTDSGLDLKKLIDSISGAAMSEQAGMLGDKYYSKDLAAWKDYSSEINDLNKKLENYSGANKEAMELAGNYWAAYRLGIKLAGNEIEHARDVLNAFGASQAKLGDLIGDPSLSVQGKLMQLSASFSKEYDSIANDSKRTEEEKAEEITTLYRRAAEDRFQIENSALGDLAKLDDGYIERKMQGIDLYVEYLRKRGVDEYTINLEASKKLDELNKQTLETRMGLEGSFTDYLADRLSLNYGLYKTAAGQLQDLWQKVGDAIVKGLDGLENAFSRTFGDAIGDLMTNKFKGVGNYIEELMAHLKEAFASFLTDMAKIALERYIVVPIIGQIAGTEGSFDLSGATAGGGTNGQGGFSLSSLSKYAGMGKTAYDLAGGAGAANTGWMASLNTWGANNLGVGSQALPAITSEGNVIAPATAGSGLGTGLGAGAAAAGIGYMAGGFIRPDNNTASLVGAGAGLAGGMVAGMAGLGMLASTGVGALVAIPAALVAGLATPNTTTSSWNSAPGSGQAIMIAGGDIVPSSYGVLKQTTSGMFGSSSTSHQTVFQAASDDMSTQEQSSWATATAGLTSFTSALNLSSDKVKDATQGFVFPMTAVPSGQEAATYKNIANAEARYTLTNLGLLDAVSAVAKGSESTIDTVTRLSSTLSAMSTIAQTAGVDMDSFTKGMDRINAANFVSQLADAVGGMDQLSAAMARLAKYAYSTDEQMTNSLDATAVEAGKAIAAVGDSSVTIDNFWARFRQAMEAGMDTSQIAAWAAASQKMEAWETAKANAEKVEADYLSKYNQQLQTQLSTVQQLLSTWQSFADSMAKLKNSLLLDTSLSPLSAQARLSQAQGTFNSLVNSANAKDTAHLADIEQAAKDYLAVAQENYGATQQYVDIFNYVTGQVDQLQALASTQASDAQRQIDAINFTIAQNQTQIDALNNVNSSVQDVVGAVNNVSAAIGGAMQAARAATTINLNMGVPAFAGGGDHKGGFRLVGEKGPELELTGPSRIYDAATTRKILGQGGGMDGNNEVLSRLDAIYSILDQSRKESSSQMDEQNGRLADVHRQLKNVEKKL